MENNRKQARKQLLIELDNYLNGDQSVDAQKKRIQLALMQKNEERAKIRREQKAKFKEQLQILKDELSKDQPPDVDQSKEIELIERLDKLSKPTKAD